MSFIKNKISDITEHSKGKKPQILITKSTVTSVPYIDIKAFEKSIVRKHCENVKINICSPEDTLIVWDGARFGLSGIGMAGAVGSTIMRLVPNKKILPKYLYWFIKSKYLEINSHPRGVGIPHVEPSFFWNLEIQYHEDKNEQQKVIKKIEELFSIIDGSTNTLKSSKKSLINLRKKILDEAFQGNLTKSKSDNNLLEDIDLINDSRKKLYSASKKGSYKLPVLPKKINVKDGWRILSLESFGLVETGATPLRGKSEFWKNGTIPWITSTVVNQQKVTKASEFITEKALSKTNTKVFPAGSLLIAMYGEGKTRGKVSELMIKTSTNQALATIVFSEEAKRYKDYIKLFLYRNYEDLRRIASGGVQPNLNLSMIKSMAIPFPDYEEQRAIINLLGKYLSVIQSSLDQTEQILTISKSLKQSILKQAFEGKLI